MATSLTACLQQANSSNLISKERTIVCEVGEFCNRQTVRIRSYGGRELVNFDRVSSWPSSLVCSTSSSRSRDSSTRRNSRSPNPKQQGRTNIKVVGVQPGDMRLLRDLQEFISSNGLPPNQVPSIRELAKRGRQDLANAVRRRGDKAVSQLLANPNFLNSSGVPSKTAKPPLPGIISPTPTKEYYSVYVPCPARVRTLWSFVCRYLSGTFMASLVRNERLSLVQSKLEVGERLHLSPSMTI